MQTHPVTLLRQLSVSEALTDGDCLRRYVETRDESAFAELVRRNGPLVLRACQSVLRDPAAADDAFQNTFVILARKARGLTGSASLAGWLYTTAIRAAGSIRRADDRRRRRERHDTHHSASSPADEVTWRDVRSAIDAELARLPEAFRTPVLLCYVQGLTYDEAARRIGCASGALRGRLERGRALLRQRLERLGIPTVVLLAGGLPAVSAELRTSTLAATRAAIPAAASYTWHLLAVCAALAAGIGFVAVTRTSADPPKPPTSPEVVAPQPREQFVDLQGDPLPPGALARLGSARFQHGGNLDRVIASGDGKLIASRAHNGYKLWDGDTGRAIPLCKELASLEKQATFSFASARDTLVAIVSQKDRIRVINPVTGAEFFSAPHTDQYMGLNVSPDGKLLVGLRARFDAARLRATLQVWDTRKKSWTELGELDANGGDARFFFSANSKIMAVKSPIGATEVWELAAAKLLLRLPATGQVLMEAISLSPDGKLVAREDWTAKVIRVYEVATGKEFPALSDPPKNLGQVLAFSPDGLLAAVDVPIQIRLWNVSTGKKVRDIRGNDYQVRDVAFVADGKRMVAADGSGVSVFDPSTGKSVVDYGGHTYTVWAAAWSPDGKRIVSGGAYTDNVARVWDPANGKKLFDLRGHVYGIEVTAYSPDGKLIATGSQDQTVRLWDADSGKALHTFEAKDGMVYALAFSPDGKFLVTAGRKSLHVWDVAARKEARTLPHVGSLALGVWFHPDGKRLVVRDRKSGIRIIDFEIGKELARFSGFGEGDTNAIAISPDGRHMLTGHGDGSIKLWDSASMREVRTLAGSSPDNPDSARVMGLAFSPDGRTVAASHGGGEVRVFEFATATTRFLFAAHLNAALRLVFSPDGRRLVSTGGDRTLIVWDITGSRLPGAAAPKDLDTAWADLAGGDAARGFAAIRYLTKNPEKAVPYLAERLKPVAAADARTVATLIAQLESPRFAERERASKELAALGEAAADQLREANAKATSAELRQRLAPLVNQINDTRLSGDQLRTCRAIEALETISTPEARKTLTALAAGASGAGLTREAMSALERLGGSAR